MPSTYYHNKLPCNHMSGKGYSQTKLVALLWSLQDKLMVTNQGVKPVRLPTAHGMKNILSFVSSVQYFSHENPAE